MLDFLRTAFIIWGAGVVLITIIFVWRMIVANKTDPLVFMLFIPGLIAILFWPILAPAMLFCWAFKKGPFEK